MSDEPIMLSDDTSAIIITGRTANRHALVTRVCTYTGCTVHPGVCLDKRDVEARALAVARRPLLCAHCSQRRTAQAHPIRLAPRAPGRYRWGGE